MIILKLLSLVCQAVLAHTLYCNPDDLIPLPGVGSSFAAPFYQEVGTLYGSNRSTNGWNVDVSFYTSSAYSIALLADGTTSDGTVFQPIYATTEAPLTSTQSAQNPTIFLLPVLAGTIDVLYNVPNVPNLILRYTDLPKIFNGQIRFWNDSAIQAVNPTVVMPYQQIMPVVRSDQAGNTLTFTSALYSADPSWNPKGTAGYSDPVFVPSGVCCNSSTWPSNVIQYYAKGMNGMLGFVNSIPYSIGYASHASTIGMETQTVTLINSLGKLVEPTPSSVNAAIAYFLKRQQGTSLVFALINALDEKAYPIASFSYLMINSTTTNRFTCCQMRELVGFIDFIVTAIPTSIAEQYGLTDVSNSAADNDVKKTLDRVTCGGEYMYPAFRASMKTQTDQNTWQWGVAVGVIVAVVVLGILVTLFMYYRRFSVDKNQWWVDEKSIKLSLNDEEQGSPSIGTSGASTPSTDGHGGTPKEMRLVQFPLTQAFCDDHPVLLASMSGLMHPKQWRAGTKRYVARMKVQIHHDNLSSFLGVTFWRGRVCCVMSAIRKGTLHFVLNTTPYDLDLGIRYNMAKDIAEGINFLHKRGLVHGQLSSLSCYVDQSWTVKVAQWDEHMLYGAVAPQAFAVILKAATAKQGYLFRDQMIRALYIDPKASGEEPLNAAHDTYSFGLLLIEIFSGELPYIELIDEDATKLARYKQVFEERETKLPNLSHKIPEHLRMVIALSLRPYWPDRPIFQRFIKELDDHNPSPNGVVDLMMGSMETHMKEMKEANIRAQQLTKRLESLMYNVLPHALAEKWFRGERMDPENFECVTVLLTRIPDLVACLADLSPGETAKLLTDIQHLIDNAAHDVDLYQADTVDGTYLFCSGMPERNEDKHSGVIGQFAKKLCIALMKFCTTDNSAQGLAIRMGISTGSATSVVGKRLPQYYVFGEAMLIAAQMEKCAQSNTVLVSDHFAKHAAMHNPAVHFTYSGDLRIEGVVGPLKTYYLDM